MKTGILAVFCAVGFTAYTGLPLAENSCADTQMPGPGYGVALDCPRGSGLSVIGAKSAPGKFSSRMIFLADQLERNVDLKVAGASYLVGSFVDLNNMNTSSPMGRLIAENLMHELQVRSWKIFEPRLMKNFLINDGGEFVLSRDVKQLRDKYHVTGVVAGTYVVSGDYTVVNARVVNIDNGVVVSSAQVQIPSNWFASGLMADTLGRPMKIVGAAQ